jgi:hypothetical protein
MPEVLEPMKITMNLHVEEDDNMTQVLISGGVVIFGALFLILLFLCSSKWRSTTVFRKKKR